MNNTWCFHFFVQMVFRNSRIVRLICYGTTSRLRVNVDNFLFLFEHGILNYLTNFKFLKHKWQFWRFKLQQIHHIDSKVLVNLMVALFGISTLFIYCFFGLLATESFDKMGGHLYNDLNWYKLPIEIQRYLVIMIADMQNSIYYHGFRYVPLDLRTFINVRSICWYDYTGIQMQLQNILLFLATADSLHLLYAIQIDDILGELRK